MIEVLSSWAKGLGLSIVVVSILEMILPNNKTKKYVRMVMGIYILFNIISPLVKNQDTFSLSEINFENNNYETSEVSNIEVDQTSMNERIEELYAKELKEDITEKLEEKGFLVDKCNVEVKITNDNNEDRIKKIKLIVEKNEKQEKTENSENKIVVQVEEIEKVDISLQNQVSERNEKTISKQDIEEIKSFLVSEYEVNENYIEIN